MAKEAEQATGGHAQLFEPVLVEQGRHVLWRGVIEFVQHPQSLANNGLI
jgi:hypothetical protein